MKSEGRCSETIPASKKQHSGRHRVSRGCDGNRSEGSEGGFLAPRERRPRFTMVSLHGWRRCVCREAQVTLIELNRDTKEIRARYQNKAKQQPKTSFYDGWRNHCNGHVSIQSFLGAFAHMDDDHHCLTENSLPAERNIRVADHHAHHVLSASRRMNSVPRLTGFHSTFASAYTALLRYEPCCFGWRCCLLVGFVLWCLVLLLGSYLLSVPI